MTGTSAPLVDGKTIFFGWSGRLNKEEIGNSINSTASLS